MNFENLKGRTGAAYLRVSTDDQDVASQRREIDDWLSKHGLTIKPENWHVDEGWARSDDEIRPAFQRLLSLIKAKKVGYVAVFDHDRFAASTPLKMMAYLATLESVGCQLISVTEESLGNLATNEMVPLFMSAINSVRTVGESKAKGKRAAEGVIEHIGNAYGGIPYAFDKVCTDYRGVEKWRLIQESGDRIDRHWPDGQVETIAGRVSKDEGDRFVFQPCRTHPERIAAVRKAYEWWTTESLISAGDIATRLADQFPPPPTKVGQWNAQFVRDMLTRPVYCYGYQPRATITQAKYYSPRGGKIVAVEGTGTSRAERAHSRQDWVLLADDTPYRDFAIVPRDQWEAAYAKMHDARERVVVRRVSRTKQDDLWLTGLVHCGHCGKPAKPISRKVGNSIERGYACKSYYTALEHRGAPCPLAGC